MSCEAKVTGSGKPIGGSGSTSEGSQEGGNKSGGSSGNGADGGGGNGQGGGAEKLAQDTTKNNIKFNKERVDEISSELRKKGYSDVQIAAVLGHWKNESSFRLDALGDGGTSYGLAQWHNERWDGLKNYAAKNGLPVNSVAAQVGYFDWELNNTEKGAGYKLKSATTVAEASWAMNSFERFQGYKDTGHSQTVGRLRNSNTFYEYLNGAK